MVGHVQPSKVGATMTAEGLDNMGPSMYHWVDDDEYERWLQEHPDFASDVMAISHIHRKEWGKSEATQRLEPCEILIEEEWVQGGLTPWIDDVREEEALAVNVDGTHDVKILLDGSLLENPLHFKIASMGIMIGKDVKDYPHVPADWYRNTTEQSHVTEAYWKHLEARTKKGEVMKMRVGSQLSQEEVRAYKELTDEFDDIFAWLYKDLKGISPDMVEHKIPPIPGGRPIRHKEKRINPRLQLLVKAELERLLNAGFIKPVEFTDWVSPMVLVERKNEIF